MNKLSPEIERDILAENLRETERALGQAAKALGITLSGYVGEVPNRYHIYAVNDDCTEFTAIHVDENNKRIRRAEGREG